MKHQNVNRRKFLKYIGLSVAAVQLPVVYANAGPVKMINAGVPEFDKHIRDRLSKNKNFNESYEDDICLDNSERLLLSSSLDRLKRIQRVVGYGNFCLLNFDDALKIARSYSRVGRFNKKETEFLEMIFYNQGETYGFRGKKPIKNLTERIIKREVTKIPRTGNYLYIGKPLEFYKNIKKQIGKDMVLTSGVRSVMKQFLLFLNKAEKSRGNLSMASRSLAPPGYSFHGVGDFDVGKIGYGINNFTEKFIETDVYKRLTDLGYIKFRYHKDNNLGVRFEPWHIKVV